MINTEPSATTPHPDIAPQVTAVPSAIKECVDPPAAPVCCKCAAYREIIAEQAIVIAEHVVVLKENLTSIFNQRHRIEKILGEKT